MNPHHRPPKLNVQFQFNEFRNRIERLKEDLEKADRRIIVLEREKQEVLDRQHYYMEQCLYESQKNAKLSQELEDEIKSKGPIMENFDYEKNMFGFSFTNDDVYEADHLGIHQMGSLSSSNLRALEEGQECK